MFEVNEAFAPVPLAWLKDIGADRRSSTPTVARSRSATRSSATAPGVIGDDCCPHIEQREFSTACRPSSRAAAGQRQHPRTAVTEAATAPPLSPSGGATSWSSR